jgi:hypothetical protein
MSAPQLALDISAPAPALSVDVQPLPHLPEGLRLLVCFSDGRFRLLTVVEARELYTQLHVLVGDIEERGR